MTVANTVGLVASAEETLPKGTLLSGGQFTIIEHLGAGGFGLTYRAKDNVLGREIVIKECFPEDICVRSGIDIVARNASCEKAKRAVVKMFMREARSLAQLRHANIVGVHRAFEENETAYMALDIIEGRDLFDVLSLQGRKLSSARVTDILWQLLDAVETIHELGLLHRDISPDNILIEESGQPVLIDFGAARGASGHKTRAVSSLLVVKDGYSPHEFYVVGAEHSPSSDLYALAATFYHVLTGMAPPDSQARMLEIASGRPDPCVPLSGRIDGYEDAFLAAIDKALQLHPADRLQSAARWKALISDVAANVPSKPKTKGQAIASEIPLDLELSLAQLVEETNDEVRRTSEIRIEEQPEVAVSVEPAKPNWIDEFNEETLYAPAETEPREVISRPTELEPQDDDEPEVWKDARRAFLTSRPVTTDINWVDRALEKQERVSASGGQTRSQTNSQDIAEVSDIWAHDAHHSRNAHRPIVQPISLLVGLCFCFALLFAVNTMDQQRLEDVKRVEAGPLKMDGNIIQ